ncbi:MAG: MerR family transcriptional regulator [Bacillota bacterium]|jgi:predicted amidophosphoribosyltransferase
MAREIRNCRRCGKLFVYVGVPVCEACVKKEEEQYARVRQYLDENPRAGVKETSEATEVPVEMVIEFVRKGLLVTSGGSGIEGISCAICGKRISSGRVCPKCEADLLTATGRSRPVAVGDDKKMSRMYSMDMISRRKS